MRTVPVAALLVLLAAVPVRAQTKQTKPPKKAPAQSAAPELSAESQKCVSCHTKKTPSIVAQWRHSGARPPGSRLLGVPRRGCGEPGAFEHEGATIVTIVTPNACANCHGDIVAENQRSHHAAAASFIGSLDNVLGEVVEGRLAAVNGCWQCHGSTVAILKNPDGSIRKTAIGAPMLDPETWPNTGIGRVNLDGSLGACTACHGRHAFSRAMARQPEVCGKCHLGPDHPQTEIYNESKHGIAYRTQISEMAWTRSTGSWASTTPRRRPARPVTCRRPRPSR